MLRAEEKGEKGKKEEKNKFLLMSSLFFFNALYCNSQFRRPLSIVDMYLVQVQVHYQHIHEAIIVCSKSRRLQNM